MSEFYYKELSLGDADHWCRELYYERLKKLNLKGKRVLEVGFDKGEVTERLIRNKDFYQYETFDSVDALKECVDYCKKRIPDHKFIHCCITSQNVTDFLDYDTYLIFYNYPILYHNEMLNILKRLVNEFNKEVILYESLVDDFNDSSDRNQPMDWELLFRLNIDPVIRLSNKILYEQYFNVRYENGFIYLYKK